VVVIDDHPVVRQGLRSLLSNYPDMTLVGEAGDAAAALDLVGRVLPDVILLDNRMPGETGVSVLPRLKQAAPNAKVLMLTSFDEDEYVTRALQSGAHGYLLKNASDEMLASAVRAVHRGERALSPPVLERVVQQFTESRQERALREAGLTAEERRILQLLAAGASNPKIAAQLYISETTVKRKLQEVFEKLGVSTRAEAAAVAVRRGLV
jgi:DNA-binding NarL/FixJ family response regulator